jgi:hypothetical protein
MFTRLSRSWALTRASWGVLRQDSQLLVFPLVASLAAIVVAGAFALGGLGLWSYDGLSGAPHERLPANIYMLGVAFYVCLYFVIFYCNAALVGAAMIRFDGGVPTVAQGWKIAASRAGNILGYAIIAATVGVVLRAIQERVGLLGRFVVGLLGVGWTVATFMVVPVLVSREVGPVEAVKESAGVLKKTWGENVIGQAGLSLAFFFVYLGVVLAAVALGVGAVVAGSGLLALVVGAGAVLALVLTALTHAALSGIYAAALYRFATTGSAGAGFDAAVLREAFALKGGK